MSLSYFIPYILELSSTPIIIMMTIIFLLLDTIMKLFVFDNKCISETIRWHILHIIGNLFITYHCLSDSYLVLIDPLNAIVNPYSIIPIVLVFVMHFYHWIFFQISSNDKIHHFLFVFIMGTLNYFYGFGPVSNLIIMFMSGFPGIVNYLLLILVELELIQKSLEKEINIYNNLYVRSVGILFGVSILFINSFMLNFWHRIICFMIMVLCIINSQIYIHKAIID
jgi:hypothetical protein